MMMVLSNVWDCVCSYPNMHII